MSHERVDDEILIQIYKIIILLVLLVVVVN